MTPTTQGTPPDRVVAFYSGGVDDRGRRLDEICRWSDLELESAHDYIQWLFPTVQPSAVNPAAPLVTPKTSERFREDANLREALRGSFDRLLQFYGLRRRTMDVTRTLIGIDPETFKERAVVWLHLGNHNHLRLTRIMQSLSSLGLATEARALQRCLLQEIFPGPGRGRITSATRRFWSGAVSAEGFPAGSA